LFFSVTLFAMPPHCSTLQSSFRYRSIAVAKSYATAQMQKVASLQPPPPFRLCQKKNNPKLY